MRRSLVIALSAVALAVPIAQAAGAARSESKAANKRTVTQKLTGQTAQAGQWGAVKVVVTMKKTTGSGSAKAVVEYTDLGGSYTYHTSRSEYIMGQALPLLRQEFLQVRSANIQTISGATYTSQAFEQSLQSALLKASR